MKAIAEFLADIIAKRMVEKFGNDFEGLKKSLEYMFSWERDFSLEVKEDGLVSSGVCPVKRFYPKYCEEGCEAFAEKFASHFNAKAERVATDPCTFKFTISR